MRLLQPASVLHGDDRPCSRGLGEEHPSDSGPSTYGFPGHRPRAIVVRRIRKRGATFGTRGRRHDVGRASSGGGAGGVLRALCRAELDKEARRQLPLPLPPLSDSGNAPRWPIIRPDPLSRPDTYLRLVGCLRVFDRCLVTSPKPAIIVAIKPLLSPPPR